MMKPNLISISMFPSVSLNDKEVLENLLGVFESQEHYTPLTWGHTEKVKLEYNLKQIAEKVCIADGISEVYLQRKNKIQYEGYFQTKQNLRSAFLFKFNTSMPEKNRESFFDFSDKLAEVLKPRYGVTTIQYSIPANWQNEQEKMLYWMYYCSRPTPADFAASGPKGFGMRTYLGYDIKNLFSDTLLKTIPGKTVLHNWGGLAVDLCEKPWTEDSNGLLEKWIAVMKHFEPSGIFAVPIFKGNMAVFFEKGQAWESWIKNNK